MSKWKDRNWRVATKQLLLSHSLKPHEGLKTQLLPPMMLPLHPTHHLLPRRGSQGGHHLLGLMPRDTPSSQVQAQLWNHL